MSVEATNWAWGIEGLLPAERLILIAIADYADENWSCFPGQETLAIRVCVSKRTVIRLLQSLEDKGLLHRERRFRADGTRTSDRFFLVRNRQGDQVTTVSRDNLSRDTGGRDQVTTVSPHEPLEEPSASIVPDAPSGTGGALIPAEWKPSQMHVDKARSLGLHVEDQAQRFIDHAIRNQRRLKSWDAGFTNWLRKAAEFNQQRQAQAVGRNAATRTFDQQKQSNMLGLIAQLEEKEKHETIGSSPAPGIRGLDRRA